MNHIPQLSFSSYRLGLRAFRPRRGSHLLLFVLARVSNSSPFPFVQDRWTTMGLHNTTFFIGYILRDPAIYTAQIVLYVYEIHHSPLIITQLILLRSCNAILDQYIYIYITRYKSNNFNRTYICPELHPSQITHAADPEICSYCQTEMRALQ